MYVGFVAYNLIPRLEVDARLIIFSTFSCYSDAPHFHILSPYSTNGGCQDLEDGSYSILLQILYKVSDAAMLLSSMITEATLSLCQNTRHGAASYQPGSTVLTFEEEELSISPDQHTTLQALLGCPGDSEGSSNSEGSHETGDSGRYSHDDTEMTNLSSGHSSRQPSLTAEDSGGSDCGGSADEPGDVTDSQSDLKFVESVENSCCHHEAQSSSQSASSL